MERAVRDELAWTVGHGHAAPRDVLPVWAGGRGVYVDGRAGQGCQVSRVRADHAWRRGLGGVVRVPRVVARPVVPRNLAEAQELGRLRPKRRPRVAAPPRPVPLRLWLPDRHLVKALLVDCPLYRRDAGQGIAVREVVEAPQSVRVCSRGYRTGPVGHVGAERQASLRGDARGRVRRAVGAPVPRRRGLRQHADRERLARLAGGKEQLPMCGRRPVYGQ